MLCIHNTHTDPAFNIAAEEYFLKDRTEDFFLLWRSQRSIIVGKHQNTYAEINLDFVRRHNIAVLRRLTGGGTVFHDPGNINYTFIRNVPPGTGIDFERYTRPILDILQGLGVEARLTGRSDLTIGGFKFSGNAQYIYRNKVLHHGTMLFSAKILDLSEALKVVPSRYEDKAIQSKRSQVTNIQEHLSEPIGILEFIDRVMDHVVSSDPAADAYEFSRHDTVNINRYREEKYSTWEWNFGSSPPYSFSRTGQVDGKKVEIRLSVKGGRILTINLKGELISQDTASFLAQALMDKLHKPEVVLEVLQRLPSDIRMGRDTMEQVARLMF